MASKKEVQAKATNAKAKTELSTSVFKSWTLLIVILITFVALIPALNNDFINFDDPQYVTENPAVQKLNTENLRQLFTQQFIGNYQPIVMLSYALQFHFFGMHAAGYHFFSLFFHLLNTALVYLIIYQLLRNNISAIIVALLFGIHPLHVESVAWVASQKDILYSFFFLASVYLYLKQKAVKEKHLSYIIMGLSCFILSVLCKAQAVVLPLVLLLIDYWQEKTISLKMIKQKIPYFIIALAFGCLAVIMQKKAGAIQDYSYFPFWERILFSCFGFINYLWQTILPVRLAIFYPYPETHDKINSDWVYIAPLVVLAFAVFVFWIRKRSPVTVFGVLFFCINIALVIQLIPVGAAIHADRYTYISLIGFFIIGGYYFGKIFMERKSARSLLSAVGTAYFLLLGVLAFIKAKEWKNSISIYTSCLAHYEAPIIYCNRGAAYFKINKYQEAFDDFNRAVILRPQFPNTFKYRALAYEKLGDIQNAIADFTTAITYNPSDMTIYKGRGDDYKTLNRFDEAIKDYDKLIAADANNAEALYLRAEAYGRSGKLTEAMTDLNKVISMKPDLDGAYSNRGIVYSMMADYPSAIKDFTKAIELNPNFWSSYYNRSLAYQSMHEYKNAYNDALIAKKNDYPVNQSYLDQLESQMKN